MADSSAFRHFADSAYNERADYKPLRSVLQETMAERLHLGFCVFDSESCYFVCYYHSDAGRRKELKVGWLRAVNVGGGS